PIVRDAALRALAQDSASRDLIQAALDDSARLVRITAVGTLGIDQAAGTPALDEFVTYLEMNSDRPSSAFLLAQVKAAEGNASAAFTLVRNAVSVDSANPAVHFEAALFFLNAGRSDEAESYFKEAVRRSPASGYFAYQYALYLVESGRIGAAEQWMKAATEREPGFHRAYYNLSVMALQKGDL